MNQGCSAGPEWGLDLRYFFFSHTIFSYHFPQKRMVPNFLINFPDKFPAPRGIDNQVNTKNAGDLLHFFAFGGEHDIG